MGRDHDQPAPKGQSSLSQLMQRAVFPYFQGTPNLSGIAAKARALARVTAPEFKSLARQIVVDAQAIADYLIDKDYRVVTGGTDNHMVLFDVLSKGITGLIAERALEECHIVVNKNSLPGDTKPPMVTSGLRLGTNSLALRGLGANEMTQCADLMHRVLSTVKTVNDRQYKLDNEVKTTIRREVQRLCIRYPIPRHGLWPEKA
jgi:glycine hydroxymethyltransferase